MTTQEIINRLMEIHEEMNPDMISAAAFDVAWVKGYADPCGCSICSLMDDLVVQMVNEAQP